MQTRALKTLVAIAKVASFAMAATRLNMTLSTVSMQMKALEDELDAALFDRSFRPPKLTPIGRTVADHALRLLAIEEALKAACSPADRLTGEFRVGFVATASVRLLPEFLIKAQELAPRATFEFTTGLSQSLEEQILDGKLDAAVVTASAQYDSRLEYDVLREEALLFAVPRGRLGVPVNKLIDDLPFLHFMPNTGVGKLIAAQMARISGDAGKTIVLDSVEAIMECVKRQIGFTLLPQPDIERYANEEVAIVSSGPGKLKRRLVLATLNSSSGRACREQLEILFDL